MSAKKQSNGHFYGGIIFLVLLCSAVYYSDSFLRSFMSVNETLPVKAVEIDGAFKQLTQKQIATLAGKLVAGKNIATLDVTQLESRLHMNPWVAQAVVQKKMPDTLLISVVEHVPAAYWNNKGLYDAHTKSVFYPDMSSFNEPLARLGAFRDELAFDVYQSAVEFIRLMRGSKYQLVELYLDQVHCYTLTLANGTKLILGREGRLASRRLKRFLNAFSATGLNIDDVSYVDLRYDVGFAVGKKDNNIEKHGEDKNVISKEKRTESAAGSKKR